MADSALELGTVLGDLALEEQLGGSVYRARRTRDGRELALRIVHPRSSQEAAEFLTLAATASRVRHPVLASVEAYGRLDGDSCYIASELVGGQRLDEWADAIGIPPLVQVVELVRRLCVGLQAAARAGVVHDSIHARSVRVLSSPNGAGARMPVKLLGLGVPALLFDARRDVHALRFMAPENLQVLSRSDLPSTFRCSAQMNVYSCGALLYYLATGGPPFAGGTVSELLASQSGAPLVPPARINPQITAGLSSVVMRALELDPGDRFSSAAELGEALAAVAGSNAPSGRRSDRAAGATSDDPFGDEPPTFRTSVAEIAELERALSTRSARASSAARTPVPASPAGALSADQDDKPTLPPAPSAVALAAGEMRDSASGVAPIGLFSSSPPHLGSRTGARVFETGQPEGSKPTPLAAFSEPPRSLNEESSLPQSSLPEAPVAPTSGIVASMPPAEPAASATAVSAVSAVSSVSSVSAVTASTASSRTATSAIGRVSTASTLAPATLSDPVRRRARAVPWPWLALPLAAVVCLLAFFTVRGLLGPDVSETSAPISPTTSIARPEAPAIVPPAVRATPPTAQGAVSKPAQVIPANNPTADAIEPTDEPEEESEERPSREGTRSGSRRSRSSAARSSSASSASTRGHAPTSTSRAHSQPNLREGLVDERLDEAVARNPPVPVPLVPTPAIPPARERVAPSAATPRPTLAPEPPDEAEPTPSRVLPLTARVRIEAVEVRGSLPTSQVRHAVDRLRSQFKTCYERAAQAAGHNGFGELIVDVEIDERGRARSPNVRGAGATGLPLLDACLTEAVLHVITGRVPDTGTVNATWKIVFKP